MAEQEPAERRRAEVYKMASLGRMLAGVVHDLSTPIGSIVSNNDVMVRSLEALKEMLARSPGTPERALKTVDALSSLAGVDRIACERLSALVRGIKTLARDDRQPARADLNQLLRDTLKLVHHQYKRRVMVETEFGELPPVECYPSLLNQVFLNLLVNAGQAIEGEGKVVVRTRQEGDCACIEVADTGRGIDPAHRDRIFSAGFTTKPAGIGTGLGLAISKEIIDAHGGAIGFDSRPGAGTTFRIRIPVERPAAKER